MQRIKILFIAVGISLGSMYAQAYSINKTASVPESAVISDTLKILAVLADFQEDKDATTFGNGKFGSIYSKDYGQSILDPLPHDHEYFSNHLEFAKNYYSKVSKGRVVISYHILPGIITVSKTMRNYSPPNNTDDLSALAIFAKEVWQKADSLNPDSDFSVYDLYTIFHAGAGRDISLSASLGNDKDLPSVYLSHDLLMNSLKENTAGLPINRRGKINSMIIPETESREMDVIGGVALVELSINGLIAANIASHLGLPDLFDTNTGLSAIGRFGLMDGQAIFTYGGVFPPEPSPWEKMYLGWIEPVEVKVNGRINLTTEEIAAASDTTVIKVPINTTEYYLIENRNRDAAGDGAIITYVSNGVTHTKTFTTDTTGFYSWNVDSLSGVVVDVDDYNWASPGNGIIIWHIDEKVISENIAANKINANKFRRGVDVEEADGIQEIGEKFYTIFGDEVIAEGTEEDLWYKGNKADLYKNRFDQNTLPSAASNSGANSLIKMTDFSGINTKMNFSLSFGDSILSIFTSRDISFLGEGAFGVTVSDSNRMYLLKNAALYYRLNDNSIAAIDSFSNFKPAVYSFDNGDIVAGVYRDKLNILKHNGSTAETQIINVNYRITAPPVISNDNREIIVGLSNGYLNYYSLPGIQFLRSERTGSAYPVKKIAAADRYTAALKYFSEGDTTAVFPANYQIGNNSDEIISSVNGKDSPLNFALIKIGNEYNYVVLERNNTYNVITGSRTERFEVNSTAEITSFAVADLKQTGEPSIIFNDGNNLRSVNMVGAGIADFPYADTSRNGFKGTPMVFDYNGDKKLEIMTYTRDGRIFLIDSDGNKVNGFPLSTGAELSSDPSLNLRNGHVSITAHSGSTLFSWNLHASNPVLYWSEEYGNNKNESAIVVTKASDPVAEFFPKERTYNWPNPVYEDHTNIRFYVSEDSRISIRIFDLAGDFVAELNPEARGGFDNEVKWDVSNIQSGVYLARIEAAGISGKTDNTIIKIAVIK